LSFDGDQYPNTAAKVITTRGDIVRGNSSGDRERYGIGAANTVLTSDGTDPDWAAAALAPTTTKGDISGFSTTQARIPVGTNNYLILADSAQALGLKWAASSTSVMSGAQDILYTSAANTLARLAAGTDGDVLTTHGTGSAVTWETPSAGGATAEIDNATITSDFSTTSSSFIDVTSLVITIGNILNGKTMISAILTIKRSTEGSMSAILEDDGSELATTFIAVESTHTKEYNMCTSYAMDSNASVIQVQVKTGGGTLVIEGASGADATSQIVSMSVG
jgi:hypothetical protein